MRSSAVGYIVAASPPQTLLSTPILLPASCVFESVVWSETVGHIGIVMLVVIMILKDTASFQVLFIVSLFCAWSILLWRSTVAFTYLKVKSVKCLCVLPLVLVLVLRIWSCLHHWFEFLENTCLPYWFAANNQSGAVASRTKQKCLTNAWIVPDCDIVLDWLAASSIAVDPQLRTIGRRRC